MKHFHLPSVLLFFLMLHPAWLEAKYYDTDILTIFSKILPRIVTMSDLDPAKGNPVTICIVHEDMDGAAARRFEALLKQNNTGRDEAHVLQTVSTDFTRLSKCKKSQLIFMFDTQPENLPRIRQTARKQRVILASYHADILPKGSDLSLYIGRSVMPYLNLRTLEEKNINIDPLLLRVSKIYRETDMP